jgi:hypothetical protein
VNSRTELPWDIIERDVEVFRPCFDCRVHNCDIEAPCLFFSASLLYLACLSGGAKKTPCVCSGSNFSKATCKEVAHLYDLSPVSCLYALELEKNGEPQI